MRPLLLALLIVLLPLRGWMGDAMAAGMLAQQTYAMQSIAETAYTTLASGTLEHHSADAAAPCADHAAAPSSPGDGKPCSSCPACDICHSVAHAPPMLIPLPTHIAGAPQPLPLLQPASAERTAGFKPPIS